MSDKTYCYPPDFKVLKNLGNIRDAETLNHFEALHTESRTNSCPFDFPITYAGYKSIHHYIFQDVYEWAGQSRKVTIHKGDSFANWMYVNREMEKRFKLIKQDQKLIINNQSEFSKRAAEHISEINAIHPFREGNGRAQRLLLRNLAYRAGFEFNIKDINKNAWMNASITSFRTCDYDLMIKCINSAISNSSKDTISE